ncbi:phage tail tape measure protein [Chromobacterium sp. IIBBL 290-4]|uniref:phage tail tape measure protein n=1 Tax=Chromobacterium sp. IIBBL 290-4 TaxID=2953890 RepID=UPI0020B6CB53|nr:phage tail tape measure protein [Chromobacterium sp. IIBBL 290-4]UTH73986.1 phage tail tape measure protein [Chromobacterium sp. IIBBL 290-4]
MANELLIGVKIGAALSGTFQSAFASARGTASRLGQVADELRLKHNRLGEAMAQAMSHPTRNVAELKRQYDRLGQTLDQLRGKQERLTASLARGEMLKAARADLRGQAFETAGTALALGGPIVKSVQVAAGFQDQMRDTAITGEFSKAEEAKLGSAVRDAALKWNQLQSEVARGTNVLVAGGIQDAKALEKYAPIMAKAATATRASMDDLGSVAIALKDNLKVGEDGFEGALNMLAYAGKRGQFEIRDMAKWLPALSPSFQALGVTGKEAVAEIGAALQIARKGAGSNDEAANNFKNFLQKITAPDTLKDFEKAGIDLKKSMMNLRAEGMTPVQSMLEIITRYMGKKGPEAAGQFQKVMAIKDDKEREAALQRLSEAYKLGELFQDMQAMSFIRPAIANMKDMKSIKDGSVEASNKDLLGGDYKKRMETATEQFKAFKIGLADIGITIGNALLPPLTEMLQALKPGVKAFGEWAKTHPGIIKGVIGLVGGLLAGKMAFIGIKYGINLVLSPLTSLTSAITTVSSKWTLLRALWQAGRFAPFISGLRSIGGGVLALGRFLLPFGRGLAMAFGSPLILAARGVLALGRVLGGGLLGGIRLAGQAILWLGRAAMMNPIGIAVMAIVGAAYLIYRYWTPIKAFFGKVWSAVDGVFKRYPILNYIFPIIGIPRLIIANWGRIKTFFSGLWEGIKQGMASAWSWMKSKVASWIVYWLPVIRFAGELPGKFLQAGKDLVMGLVNGIKSKLGAAKDAIVGLGAGIKGWFANTLGIKSPSRIFMGFGDNIAQGAAIGIQRSAAGAGQASGAMALATIRGWGKPQLPVAAAGPDALSGLSARAAGSAQSRLANRVRAAAQPTETEPAAAQAAKPKPEKPGYVIHFSPVIHLPAGAPEAAKAAVQSGLQLSLRELEQMIRRITAQQDRRAFN